MKNVLKKISAIAMVFTLLGTGTAFTANASPQDNFDKNVSHPCGQYKQTRVIEDINWEHCIIYHQDYCAICGKDIGSRRTVYEDHLFSPPNWLWDALRRLQ